MISAFLKSFQWNSKGIFSEKSLLLALPSSSGPEDDSKADKEKSRTSKDDKDLLLTKSAMMGREKTEIERQWVYCRVGLSRNGLFLSHTLSSPIREARERAKWWKSFLDKPTLVYCMAFPNFTRSTPLWQLSLQTTKKQQYKFFLTLRIAPVHTSYLQALSLVSPRALHLRAHAAAIRWTL